MRRALFTLAELSNPFNPSTVIDMNWQSLPASELHLYIMGRSQDPVRWISEQSLRPHGMGRHGHLAGVPAGVYIYSLSADGIFISKKMLCRRRQKSVTRPCPGRTRLSGTGKTVSINTGEITATDRTHEEQNLSSPRIQHLISPFRHLDMDATLPIVKIVIV